METGHCLFWSALTAFLPSPPHFSTPFLCQFTTYPYLCPVLLKGLEH